MFKLVKDVYVLIKFLKLKNIWHKHLYFLGNLYLIRI